MPSKKKGNLSGKAESPTLGQQKLPCNCVTNPLAPTTCCVTNPLMPTTCCFFWPNKYPRELGFGAFPPQTLGEGGRPWLESVIKSPIASCIVSRSLLSRPGTRTMGRTALTSQLFAYFLEQALGCMLVQLSYLPQGRVQWPQWCTLCWTPSSTV